jgi:hypothetical protein
MTLSKREDPMFRYLLRTVRRVLAALRDALPLEPPQDPYARVRVPRRRGPGGRYDAVALAEPEEQPVVRAVSGSERPRTK